MTSTFYKICDEKNILLEKNDDDDYRINMSIVPNEKNEFTLVDIVDERELWNLLYQLNNDIIEEYNIETVDESTQNLFLKIKADDQMPDDFSNLQIELEVKYISDSPKKCEIKCNTLKKDSNAIHLRDFFICIDCYTGVTNVSMGFKLTGFNDIVNTFVALYIKKIFYRLSRYLQ